MEGDRCYLSIVSWPETMGLSQRSALLSATAGLDPHVASQTAARPTPSIACLLDSSVAEDVLRPLRSADVAAIAPTANDIEACSRRTPAKSLERLEDGEMLVHAWRGNGRVLRSEQLLMFVRGRLARRETTSELEPPKARGWTGDDLTLANGHAPGSEAATRSTTTHEVLDLYDREGEAVRIDARKFNFDVLGKRSYTDKENLDRLCAMLLSMRPADAGMLPIDQDFRTWRPPVHLSSFVSGASPSAGRRLVTDETDAFDFYSAWRFIVHCSEIGAA